MRFTVFVLFMFMVISIGINLEVSSASWQAHNDCIYEKGDSS